MIAALWSNSNWDDDKGTRKNQIADMESQYEEALKAIKSPGAFAAEEEIDDNNPFFAATERGLAKIEQKMGYTPSSEEQDELNMMKGLDQE